MTGRDDDFVLRTIDLTKCYGRRCVLQSLRLDVRRGSLFGFLGPNGAGKSTTIRILLGLLRASAGRAAVLGMDVWRDGPRVRREVGYLPGDIRLYEHMRGGKFLRLMDSARGGGGMAEARRLLEVFALDPVKRIRTYSRGMKQKIGLIAALMHRPKLLILDEPTTALDPVMRELLYGELRRARDEGRTVLFSSHTLSEVEQLCSAVAILRDGRLVEQETIDSLRRRAVRRIELVFDGPPPALPRPPELHVLEQTGALLIGAWRGPTSALLRWLEGVPVRDLIISQPDLEELFLAYYADAGDSAAQCADAAGRQASAAGGPAGAERAA